MKSFSRSCILLFVCIFIAASVQLGMWRFCRPEIVGSVIETDSTGLASIAGDWFNEYAEGLAGPQVPYRYRLKSYKNEQITVLDEQAGFVQIDFFIEPVSANDKLIEYYECTASDEGGDGFYKCQYVLQFSQIDGAEKPSFEVIQKMRPVQYQLMTDPQASIQTDAVPYLMEDRDCTYAFSQQKLYVTYDHGQSFTQVPIEYDSIARTNNGTYDEYIPDSARIITRQFTAFVGFNGQNAFLLYSTDTGESWNESNIFNIDFRSAPFISKTETKCYVSVAVDRTLGRDYYATFETSDFESWQMLTGDSFSASSYTCVYFTHDNTGYICPELHSQDNSCAFYYTEDNGKTFTEISLEPPSDTVNLLGYNPFTTVENIRVENGSVYLTVGQDEMGDYARDGKLVKALYISDDGVNFKFDSEIFNDPVQAG